MTKTLKRVKVARISYLQGQNLASLPSTIRIIDGSWNREHKLKGVLNQFPDLIEVTGLLLIQPTDKSKLRAIWPIFEETEEKFNLRPRKIKVDSNNVLHLNNHPELFEKVEWVCIYTNQFNFDVLSSEINRIEIYYGVNEESVTLNRLEKERG